MNFGGLGRPLGHEQVTVGTSVVALPDIPPDFRRALIRVIGQPINFRDDGVAPTSTTGMRLLADETLVFDSDPTDFQLIRATDATGDADVRVAYYR